MKKTFLLLCIPALLFTGCDRLEIPNTDSTADTETTTDDSDDKEDDTGSTGATGTVDPELSWSDSACIVTYGNEDTYFFPNLTCPDDLTVTYSSSHEDVATIDEDGDITIAGVGSTVISASFAGNDYYKSASATYTLVVTSSDDDGAGTYTFASAGDTSSEDDISNTTFTRLVTVTYASGGATVSGYGAVAGVMDVSVSGATVVAYGGLEKNYSASQTVYSMTGTAGSWNALYNGSSFIAAFKAPSGVSSFAVSAPSLSKGYKGVSVGSTTSCNGTWATSGISGGTAVTLSSYSGGQGGPGGGGGGRPW